MFGQTRSHQINHDYRLTGNRYWWDLIILCTIHIYVAPCWCGESLLLIPASEASFHLVGNLWFLIFVDVTDSCALLTDQIVQTVTDLVLQASC